MENKSQIAEMCIHETSLLRTEPTKLTTRRQPDIFLFTLTADLLGYLVLMGNLMQMNIETIERNDIEMVEHPH